MCILLGQKGEDWFDEEDEAVKGPVGTPQPCIGSLRALEGGEGLPDGHDEGER